MAVSQNGWPIVGKSACDQGPFAGVVFPNGILKGDVATIARWQLAEYERRVEPLVPGTCWGWFVKLIEGSATRSNHGSGTAWDNNATQHPMGVPASHNMSPAQISACHAIEAESQGTLRWGGDFSRPDPMHWEIIGSRAMAAAFATKIRNEQEDDHMTLEEMKTLANLIADAVVDKWVRKDLGAAGGGDTVGVVMQTGVLGNSMKILGLLEEISAKLTPVPEGS
jgi:hypothetical protein